MSTPITSETFATRFSASCGVLRLDETGTCLLVRIHPVSGVEPPVELGPTPMLVGRDGPCGLTLCDDSVSRRHAVLEPLEGGHRVTDLGSTNGTYVNERRVALSQSLQPGDRVRFGNQIFKYLGSEGVEAQYHEVVFKLMTTDGLTGVHNKRYLLEALQRELHQSRRTKTHLAVMMLDLDKFKSINDAHGHLAGDAVLVEFAQRAQSVLRSGDLLARYGGEEFAMLLSRTELDEAVQIAERVRQLTAATPVRFERHNIPITVSIGVSCQSFESDPSPADLLAVADQCLYAAKNAGRNQVLF